MHKELETKEINSSVNTPAREGYKQTKLGWIPEDWKLIKLGNIFRKIIGGGTPSKSNLDYWNGKIPWSTVKDLSSFNEYSTQQYISDIGLKNSSANLIPPSTIITATRMLLGVAVKYKIAVAINQDLKALFTNDKVDDNFLLQWFKKYQKKINYLGSGSTVKGISLTAFKNIKIILPPLPEQQKIAQILSTWDKAIVLQEQLIAEKQALKKGLMQELLTGKKRFPGFDGEWEEVKIKEIASTFSGGTPSSKRKEYYNGDIPWLKSGELNKGIIQKTDGFISELGLKNSSAKLVGANTILIAMYGATAGVCAITKIEGAINQAVLALILKPEYEIYFVYQLLRMKMPNIVHRMVQGGQPNLSGGIINSVKIKLPGKEEQWIIAATLQNFDDEIKNLIKYKDYLIQQKQGLVQQLLTGEKRVKI